MEGIVDHHLLGVHHVREAAANPLLWDIGFLVLGALLVASGYALARSEASTAAARMRRAA